VVGFGARALSDDDNPKYLNSPQTPVFDKSRILYGLDMGKRAIRDSETAVIVEGYMDVIQAHQAGFTNVVAQMGTAMTETQLKLLVPRYAKKVILALDSDAAGQSATRRSLETARQTLESDYAGRLSADIRILQIPGAKDPDDLIRESPDDWQGLIDAAIPVADFVINMEMAELAENATIQERETVARSILPLLVASESDLYRKDNIQKLAMRLHIPERSLLAWANEQSQIQNWKSRAAHADADRDQPPPPDYDSMEPPPDIDDEDNHFASSARRAIGAAFDSPDNSLEGRTLRILFTQTNFYYLVNRRFRELAVGNPALQHGPLGELCAEDFTRSAYRELMKVFIQAVGQQEMDVIDFPPKNIDPLLKREYDELFIEDADGISRRVHHRFSHDVSDVLKRQDRYARPGLNLGEELLEKALQLRLRRIKQEMDELRFIQLDVQEQVIAQPDSLQLGIRIFHLVRARQLLEPELQQQVSRLM
jgi:DNA primase